MILLKISDKQISWHTFEQLVYTIRKNKLNVTFSRLIDQCPVVIKAFLGDIVDSTPKDRLYLEGTIVSVLNNDFSARELRCLRSLAKKYKFTLHVES